MALSYEQAIEAYLLEALEKSADVSIDSPNRDRSQFRRGMWHLRNFEGLLIARVGADFVRFAPA